MTFLQLLMTCCHSQIDAAKPIEEVFEDVKAVILAHEKVKRRNYKIWNCNQYISFLFTKLKLGMGLPQRGWLRYKLS